MSIESELIMKGANELVIEKGEKAKTLYQLVDGCLIREEDNEEILSDQALFGFVEPGPFFLNSEYGSTVKTKGPSSLVAISKNSKLAVIRNFPQLVLKLYEETSS